MLLTKIDAAKYASLPQVLQAEYTLNGTDYLLQTDDINELRNAKARETTARQTAETQLANMTGERDRVVAEFNGFKSANPDRATAEAEVQKRIKQAVDAEAAKIAPISTRSKALEQTLSQTLLDNTVNSIITGMTAPEDADLLRPHVAKRIKIDVSGEKPVVSFLDDEGRDTADNLASFKNVIANDKRYSKIVLGSRATGSGADGGKQGNGNPSGATGQKKFSEMTGQEKTQLYRDNPAEFKRLSDAANANRFAQGQLNPVPQQNRI